MQGKKKEKSMVPQTSSTYESALAKSDVEKFSMVMLSGESIEITKDVATRLERILGQPAHPSMVTVTDVSGNPGLYRLSHVSYIKPISTRFA